MIPRVLEPEAMETPDEADDYDAMDHCEVNERFARDLLAECSQRDKSGVCHILDAGTGTALIPIILMRLAIPAGFRCQIVAADASAAMLKHARQNVARAGLSESIQVVEADCKQLQEAEGTYDIVMSNSLIHHLANPVPVWAEFWRVLKPGGLLFVRDLFRPESQQAVENVVSRVAGTETPSQQQLLRQSLQAALTVSEVADMLATVGLPREGVQASSDRHWTVLIRKPGGEN